MLGGRETQRIVEETTANATETQDLPVDGLGFLPEPYSCSCHPDGKTCLHAHARASEEIPVEASKSNFKQHVYVFIYKNRC